MNKKLISTFILIFFTNIVFGQAPTIQWQKSFGGSDNEVDNSIYQTSDGGYIIAGTSRSINGDITGSHGDNDAWVVKIDNNGTKQWQKSLGGTKSDRISSIKQTVDGGYIMAGSSNSNDGDVSGNRGDYDFWIVKLDNNGSIQWQKSLGGKSNDSAIDIQQTSDNGFIVVGDTYSDNSGMFPGDVSGNHGGQDLWVVKLDNNGTIKWQKCLGGSEIEFASYIQQTSDGGYILGGYTASINGDVTSNYGGDGWIVKLNSDGTIQWQRTLGSTYNDVVKSIKQTSDGGYIVASTVAKGDGDVLVHYGNNDIWIVKLDSNGAIQWQKTFGGIQFDQVSSIELTSDNGYILAASSNSIDKDVTGNHGSSDYWVVKLNSNGALQWQKSLGGSTLDTAYSIKQTLDGGYIVAGISNSNNGDVTGNHGLQDYWIVKLNPENLSINEIASKNTVLVENPVKDLLKIHSKEKITSLQLYSIDGKLIKTSNSQNVSVKELSKGVYILKIELENGKVISEKIIKE